MCGQARLVVLLEDCQQLRGFELECTNADYKDWQDLQTAVTAYRQKPEVVSVVITSRLNLLRSLRAACPTTFLVLWHEAATESAALRLAAFRTGANMVTCSTQHLGDACRRVASQTEDSGPYTCEWCGLQSLSGAGLWTHQPLYHIYHHNISARCQICKKTTSNMAKHLHDIHHPQGAPPEERTGLFALTVIRRPSDGKFLMTQEFNGAGFWLPGGGVDLLEPVRDGAVREAKEEAGVEVVLTGVLTVERSSSGAWRRFIFLAEPKDSSQQPKTVPDFESAGACWVSVDELDTIPLRSSVEPRTWYTHVVNHGKILPLEIPKQHEKYFCDVQF